MAGNLNPTVCGITFLIWKVSFSAVKCFLCILLLSHIVKYTSHPPPNRVGRQLCFAELACKGDFGHHTPHLRLLKLCLKTVFAVFEVGVKQDCLTRLKTAFHDANGKRVCTT
jgi:hypothetical protein